MIYADSTKIRRIDINNADFKTLLRHPYLEMEDVQAIEKYRKLHGNIGSVSEIISQKVLTPEKAYRVLPYLQFIALAPAGR
jgi:DNA uptake protein ComE-like DNA-binding protein